MKSFWKEIKYLFECMGTKATYELGKLVNEHYIDSFVKSLKAIKADTKTLELQNEFFNRVKTAP